MSPKRYVDSAFQPFAALVVYRRSLLCLLVPLIPAALALVGCVGGERPPDPRLEARRALEQQTEAGPVLAVVHGNPFTIPDGQLATLVSQNMAEGVRGLGVRFTPDPERAAASDPRLVVVLNPLGAPEPSTICRAPGAIPTGPAGEELQIAALLCRGDEPLGLVRNQAAVASANDRSFQRLLWRTAGQLFPDDYAERFGFDLIPGVDVGVGGSFGF
jgi:hypothetical protein